MNFLVLPVSSGYPAVDAVGWLGSEPLRLPSVLRELLLDMLSSIARLACVSLRSLFIAIFSHLELISGRCSSFICVFSFDFLRLLWMQLPLSVGWNEDARPLRPGKANRIRCPAWGLCAEGSNWSCERICWGGTKTCGQQSDRNHLQHQ